jgi:hypothetical protein
VKDDKSEGATGVAIQEAPFLRFSGKFEGGKTMINKEGMKKRTDRSREVNIGH